MSRPVSIHERTPVRDALRILAASHLREIAVVAEDGTPIGIFRDVEGLHWMGRTRADEDDGVRVARIATMSNASILRDTPANLVPLLEHLLERSTDGMEGYHVAADAVSEPALRAVLQRNAVEREEITSVLANMIVEQRAHPTRHGALGGVFHRAILSALGAAHADHAIIVECRRGDEAAIATFGHALAHELPSDVRTRLVTLRARVAEALARLPAGVP